MAKGAVKAVRVALQFEALPCAPDLLVRLLPDGPDDIRFALGVDARE